MIVTCGIDLVTLHRFARWPNYSAQRAARLLGQAEYTYTHAPGIDTQISIRRCASVFALKEAAYKALSAHLLEPMNFLAFARACTILFRQGHAPSIVLQEAILPGNWQISASLSHEKELVIALVTAYRIEQ